MLTFYALLLRLYPASFRDEYGAEMRAVFEDELRRTSRLAVLGLWARTVADLLRSAAAAHLDILRQDLSYTARVLGRAPGFTLTAILVVALGIGATTAAFSVTDFVLIRPLAFPEPDRLVKIWATTPGYGQMELAPPNYRDVKAAATSFQSMGAYYSSGVTMTGAGDPRRLVGAMVTAGVFETLRARPLLGRTFRESDDRPGAAGRVILSHELWQHDFGADPLIVGRQITLDQEPCTVVGVMPATFHFPTSEETFWIPARFRDAAFGTEERTNNLLEVVARLRAGKTIEQAESELSVIAAQLRRAYPRENKDTGAAVFPLDRQISERSRLMLIALFGASACVLLVACANLAGLLLARALSRRREMALRTAIGAGRQRLVRQLMTESLVLAGVGGLLGVAVAIATVPLLARLVPSTLPIGAAPSVDPRVLLFAAALTLATGLGFGLVPVLRIGSDADLEGLRSRSSGTARERLRSVLVASEIAASVALLVSAGLLLRALVTIRDTNPGFVAEGVLTMRTELPMPQYETVAAREAFYARVLDQVRSLPGVSAAGYVSFLPMSSFRGGIWPVLVKGDAEAETDVRSANNTASLRYVTPGYFQAMRIPVIRGRDLGPQDDRSHAFAAVVSESFARRYWPGQEPIGRHFTFAFADREVVGVVGDVRFRGLERQNEPQAYLSSRQVADAAITFYAPQALAIRSATPTERLAAAVRAIVRRTDPQVPISELQTLSDMVALDTATRSVQLRILGAFAFVAFALAGIGIHGLLSFAVAHRTQEIGVRMALGAGPADIVGMVLRRCAALAVGGLVPGVAAAFAVGRGMQALLAGVAPSDGPTLGAAIGLVVVMTMAGGLFPALRALRVDPVKALRAE